MSNCVLDASAVLVFLHRERGSEAIARLLDGAAISAVNVAEVSTKLADEGVSEQQVRDAIRWLEIETVGFDEDLSHQAAALRRATRAAGLSLGDCVCLATAKHRGVRAVTADRAWSRLQVGVKIQVIR